MILRPSTNFALCKNRMRPDAACRRCRRCNRALPRPTPDQLCAACRADRTEVPQ
jgi:hypothetical protein